MPRILVVVVGLVCSLLVPAEPVTAADGKRRITMAPPVAAGAGAVLLTGRVSSSDARVVLQRSADGRWVRVRTVAVRQHGYQTTVRARPRTQRFRVKAGGSVSQVRVVRPSRPTPTQDACGKRPRKPGGSRWSCTFVDDFDGVALNRSRWAPHTTFVTGDEGGSYACHRDHPDNFSVARGTLRLTLRRHDEPVACGDPSHAPSRFTSGMVSTYHRFSQRYGRFEARIKVTATTERGLQEAFWMWPDQREGPPLRWPSSGEIDIAETYSQHPDLAIPFLHYSWNDNGGPQPGLNTAWDCPAKRGVFNTYTLEWSATRIEIFVNGRSCLVNTSGDTAFQRKYILALTQALGVKRNRYQVNTPMPATMTIDYVRAWR
jgi:beta-glucanase (GH16 family)